LYVNLRGFEDTDVVLDPAEALRGLLDALGADPLHRPDRLGALTALYRSALAGRRCLLVLDNARDTGQVLPLLPGPGCLVLVTSRLALPGLVAGTGAHTVGLDLLTDAEAAEFVRGRLGAARVAAAPEAVARLVRVCARLPLALAVVCARAAGTPELPLADVADELEAAHGLDGFACPDGKGDVRAVLSWSYRALAPPAARLFRFLSLVPSAVTDTQVAAALSGQPPLRVLTQLRELANAHLLTEDEPGRFRWHDLVRAYANELREQVDPMPERMAAWRRVVGHYLGMARAAASVLDNHTGDQPEAEDGPPVTAPATYADALDWFTREHSALLTVLEHATGTGCLRQAWQLVWALRHYLDWAGHWAELATAARTALRAAHSEHDPVGEAYGLRVLARVDAHRGDLATAHAALARAVAGYERLGDRRAVAFTLRQWAGVSQLAGDHATAAARAAQALALFRELDHRPGVAGALVALSTNLKGLGEFEQALAAAREALTLLPETPSYELMMATYATASAYRELGRHEEAARTHERELTLLRELGAGLATGRSLLYRLVTATLLSIATAWEAAGDQPRASLALREAMDRLRVELRDPRLFAGRYDPADERLAEAVAVLSAALDRSDPAGWHDRAREALARTVALLEEVGISDYLHN
ncbi:tetratricopeptide repeat protein, partial [Crossiella equi]